MSSLRARLLLAFGTLGLALLVAVGAALFVVLRDLNQNALSGALTDTAVQQVARARQRLVAGLPPAMVLGDLEATLASTDISLLYVDGQGRVLAGSGADAPARVDLSRPGGRGALAKGTYRVGGHPYVFVAVSVSAAGSALGARALVFARPDVSTAAALGDLARALVVALVVVLLVGAVLASLLARSIARPLERLAAATKDVGRGTLPPPLPLDGPAEIAHASASFNTMTAEVAHARKQEADLLAGLRHDLRTPLTVIGGFAQALQDGTASGPAARRAAVAIADETARLERMVDDLGALADLETGGRALRLEQLDALLIAQQAAERFVSRAAADGQQVTATAEPSPIPFAGDRTALERILGNLVANALRAAPRPGGHVHIEASSLPGSAILLAVRDDGPGIPNDALPRIFERFFRADPARSGPGSGLGLAIVAELARAHGGRAFAENLPGGGARVGVLLPATPPLAAARLSAPAPSRA